MKVPSPLAKTLREYLLVPGGTCPVCARVLFHTREAVCSRCGEDLPRQGTARCSACGRPIGGSPPLEEEGVCGACGRLRPLPLAGGYAWLIYKDGATELIAALKFGKRPALGEWIGTEMAREMQTLPWVKNIDAVLPVPLHANRLAQRGYNQSAGVARGLATGLGREFLPDALLRIVDTPHQIGLNREERRDNLSGAFGVSEPAAVAGRSLLLVDDVLTTGSTIYECAKTLGQVGARRVYVATIAAATDAD